MRFWIITSRILQNHLFWDTDLSQCGKGWIVLALKTVKQVLLSGGGFGGGGDSPAWRMDRGETLQLIAFEKMTSSLQDKLDYAFMAFSAFADLYHTILQLDVVVFAHVHCNKRIPCRASAHKDTNCITGLSLFYGQCQVTKSAQSIARENGIFVFYHVLWLMVTSLAS